ncbi:hypothetical protein [Nocardia cyriacigeorgica]|uniref:hypothetical protein n=1 Tax=Nocardia cyriacigeorgica TaxID=135487 RepID=UPI0014864CD8|nr:hypothetical protein [Nocardia cyriacigeorgica]
MRFDDDVAHTDHECIHTVGQQLDCSGSARPPGDLGHRGQQFRPVCRPNGVSRTRDWIVVEGHGVPVAGYDTLAARHHGTFGRHHNIAARRHNVLARRHNVLARRHGIHARHPGTLAR